MSIRSLLILAGVMSFWVGQDYAADKPPESFRLLTCLSGPNTISHVTMGDPDIVTAAGGVVIISGLERAESGEVSPFKVIEQGGLCNLVKIAPPPIVMTSPVAGKYKLAIDFHHEQDLVWHTEASLHADDPLKLKSKTDLKAGEEAQSWVGIDLKLNAKADEQPSITYTITHYDHGALTTLTNTAPVGTDGIIKGKTAGYDTALPLDYVLTLTKP